MSGFFPEKWSWESGHAGTHVCLQTWGFTGQAGGMHTCKCMQGCTHTHYTPLSHVASVHPGRSMRLCPTQQVMFLLQPEVHASLRMKTSVLLRDFSMGAGYCSLQMERMLPGLLGAHSVCPQGAIIRAMCLWPEALKQPASSATWAAQGRICPLRKRVI